jgi:hypothetical protein
MTLVSRLKLAVCMHSETLTMELVRVQTIIVPVPGVLRVIRHVHGEEDYLLVMDLIQNSRRLGVCRPTLSLWAKLQVVLTMRTYT